ncbi:hypothetical protein Dimus_025298 [Dionaea muscipula]
MRKIVVKLDLHDDKAKQKALKTVATLSGIDFISMDMKTRQLTVIGPVDAISMVSKLRKFWPDTEILTVGPSKEPEKKEEPKKEEAKPEEAKKDEAKKEEEGKKEEGKKEEAKAEEPKKEEAKKEEPKKEEEKKPDPILELIKAYKQMQQYNQVQPMPRYYYHAPSMEENPNACTIV